MYDMSIPMIEDIIKATVNARKEIAEETKEIKAKNKLNHNG